MGIQITYEGGDVIKLFIDTLDIESIKKYNNMDLLDGVTTNPTMARKFKMKNDEDMIIKLREVIGNKEIHIEAFGETADEILLNSDRLLGTGKNLVFKIPFSEGGVLATRALIKMGYKTNLHLIYSFNQALISAQAKSTYICPLIGRLDDVGHNAIENVRLMTKLNTQVMASSIRYPQHVMKAYEVGVDAITIPPNIFKLMFKHPLTDQSIEKFKVDIAALKKI